MYSQLSLRHRIIFNFLVSNCIFFTYTIYGQSLSETWNPPVYQSTEYSEFYGGVYFSKSLDEWEYKVQEVLYQSMANWKVAADSVVEQMLTLENGSDAFINNEGYLDERRKSLFSEIAVFYSAWERDLIDDYFENRNSFLQKLETGRVDSLYFQRIGQVSMYEEYTIEEMKVAENRNRILESARDWEFQWNQTRQQGLDDFANSFTELESDYQDYLQSLSDTESRFAENLEAINSYKETIKFALKDMVSQLKLGLDSECSVDTGCQFKNFDGSFNEAGKLFSKFLLDLTEELNGPNIDPDSILTLVSTKIKDFLSNETNKAFTEYTFYNDQIYTYQTGFQINLDQTKTKFDLGGALWNLRYQSFWQLSSDKRYENWLAGGPGEVGYFGRVYDPELRVIFQSIHYSDFQTLISVINSKLGEGRRVQSMISANLYTDAYNFINNENFGGFYVPFDKAHHTSGNLLLDGGSKYGYWMAERSVSMSDQKRAEFQMGAIGYSVLYEMYDDNSYQTSLYWNGNYSQLGGQRDHFQDILLPAVSHWETKVKEYSDFYESWKDNRENLLAEATAKLEANRMELERSKEDWLQRLEDEKRNGIRSWTDLYKSGKETEMINPEISSWSPSQKSVPFQDSKFSEFQDLSNFNGAIDGITIGSSNLLFELQRSIVGVSQYASVLQMNTDLEELKQLEQKKLVNQMAYEIRWDSLGGRELTKEEKILLGNYDVNQLSKEEQNRFGTCYENPEQNVCQSLLKKEYDTVIDTRNGVLTLKKEIHNGLLAGKNSDGQYTAGKMDEVRYVQLSSLEKLQVAKTNDFFTIWEEDDWASLYQKKSEITESFLTHSLQKDKQFINSNLVSIQEKDNRNKELFLERKESQENADSIFQELAVAYLTGGAAGVKTSLTGKLESTINSEIAKAWITATGGSESDIQTASMLIDFMRGKMSAKKIQSRDQYISIKNPIQAFESIYAKTFTTTLKVLDAGTLGLTSSALSLIQAPSMAAYKTLVGEKQFNKTNDQIAGTGKRLEEIKANELMLVQNGISTAIAKSTGMPVEAISKFIGDKYSQMKAKQANKDMGKNPIFDFGSQIVGAIGGIAKTAIVALGMPEDEIQVILQDTNGIINAGNLNQNSFNKVSFGYTLQALGMQPSWTQHQSAYLDLHDSKAVIEDLGKKALSKELAKSLGVSETAIGQIVDSHYASYQKQKTDKKARSKAVRQTVVNAASVAITLGASGALSGVSSALSNIGKAVSTITNGILPATTQIGQVAATTLVQTVAGSHEGPKGAIAGFANGVLGGVTQGIGKIQSEFFKGLVPGIGITYSDKNGWGGSLGIGNTISNLSVSFSENGDTTLQGSQSLNGGVQLTADLTTNGATNLGLNYNPTGQGPRKDWNFTMMYDFNGGGLSGGIGYTNPNSTLGLTSTINKDGLSTSAEMTGVSIATNGSTGFQMDEMNFAEQNINAAQDASEIGNKVTSSTEKDSPDPEADLFQDFSDAGLALVGLLAGATTLATKLFLGGTPLPSQGAATNTVGVEGIERERRKEVEGEGDEPPERSTDHLDSELAHSNVIDLSNPEISDQVGVGRVDIPAFEFKSENVTTIDEFQKDVEAGAANRSLVYDSSTDKYVSETGKLYTADEVAALHQADVLAGIQYKTADGMQLGIVSSINSFFGNETALSSHVQNSDTNHREKNKFGEVVFTKYQVENFNKKDKINIYGSEFVKQNINGTDYFVREKNGELQSLILREDGRIMETCFQINRSIFGTSYSNGKIKLFDAIGKEITSSNSGQYNPNLSAAQALEDFDKIEAVKNSIFENFSKDSRLTSEKKLLELRLLGAETTDLENLLTKKRGKDKPLSGAALVEFEEYKRTREKKPLWSEPAGGYKTSTDALSSVNLIQDKTKETNAEYFQRLGNEIREASKVVDLSDQKKLNEHLASVAKILGSNLDGKISYAQELDINGKLEVSGANTVDSNGFRAVTGTDCIRWIGGVFSAAGYTGFGSFANLNTNTYLLADDVNRMNEMITNKQAHGNGVEFLRQASNLLERTSPLITSEAGNAVKGDGFKVPDLEVGQIGITRKPEPDKHGPMKSDHVYIIVDKRYNEETRQFEYKISESYLNHGPATRWISHPDSSYLKRSEFYKVKPQDQ
ncbi:TIGR04388 family protein [Leptospira montravelensis]|uniref:TIGR04388 family protein n=1 Tax=Leptospira montravelensis TaxID=2484961 RepID=A0ABY2M037_9LEPT|nr:TIGR04388 family protein [Leptospira montravelensis]TGK84380.1 TIGR04388 family protein [Leptospira montravelensis]TGL06853.1 TIGR04388 family protein [Leptospira montravelensis]